MSIERWSHSAYIVRFGLHDQRSVQLHCFPALGFDGVVAKLRATSQR